jgi:hypothetical protein
LLSSQQNNQSVFAATAFAGRVVFRKTNIIICEKFPGNCNQNVQNKGFHTMQQINGGTLVILMVMHLSCIFAFLHTEGTQIIDSDSGEKENPTQMRQFSPGNLHSRRA